MNVLNCLHEIHFGVLPLLLSSDVHPQQTARCMLHSERSSGHMCIFVSAGAEGEEPERAQQVKSSCVFSVLSNESFTELITWVKAGICENFWTFIFAIEINC